MMYSGPHYPDTSGLERIFVVVGPRHSMGTQTAIDSRNLRKLDMIVDNFARIVRDFKEYVDKAIANAAAWKARMRRFRPRLRVLACPRAQCRIGCSYLAALPRCKLKRWPSLNERRIAWGIRA